MEYNAGPFVGRVVVLAALAIVLSWPMSCAIAEETVEADLEHQRQLCDLDNGQACAQLGRSGAAAQRVVGRARALNLPRLVGSRTREVRVLCTARPHGRNQIRSTAAVRPR
jgi:hypothetical protein